MNPNSFLHALLDINCIRFGKFTLKNGSISPIYLDLRNLISYPSLMEDIASRILPFITPDIDRICGVPYAALPMATVVSMKTQIPLLIKRKEAKNYGTKKIIEGEYNKGDRILLIEDVITSGASLIETIDELEKEGLIIEQIITLVDREQGGSDLLSSKSYSLKSLFGISEIITTLYKEKKIEQVLYDEVVAYLKQSPTPEVQSPKRKLPAHHAHPTAQKLLDIAHSKRSNLIASVDLTTCAEVLNFLRKTGPFICAAKIHVDILVDFTTDFLRELKQIAIENNFLIIEDRKFADIGNTQLLQLSQGIYSIASWADMVTIHLIAGEAALKAIKDWETDRKPALIPIIEMSSAGALTDKNYVENCSKFLYNYPDVVGTVCQKFEPEKGLLKFTPGINLATKSDNKGQQYNSPEFAISTLHSDFLIIGRGLYEAANPEIEIEKYLAAVRECEIF